MTLFVSDWTLKVEQESNGLFWQGRDMSLRADFAVEWSTFSSKEPMLKEGWRFKKRLEVEEKGQTVISDFFSCEEMEVIRQIRFSSDNPSSIDTRLIARNQGEEPIFLHTLSPIIIHREGLTFNQANASNWVFYRSGRQKNDLPAVCVLGEDNEAYTDALGGLSETGASLSEIDGAQNEIVSDELSVIVAGQESGAPSLLIGFIDGRKQLVECRIRMDQSRQTLESLNANCLLDGIQLEPGDKCESEWVRLDGNEAFQAVEQFVHVKQQETTSIAGVHPPSVFCTWYYYGDTVNQEDVYTNLDTLQEKQVPVDVFQVDEGWERRSGEWEPNHRFPDGMEAVANRIRGAGYRPGIWTAPFIVEPRSELRFYHEDWLLKDRNGDPVLFYMNNIHNMVWDVTHPEVQEWIEQLYRKLTDWGYTYHKLDFTRAVAPDTEVNYYNPSVTRAQAYRMGIEAVRRGLGDKGYLLICGGLYSPSASLVDAQRTSSDVLSMWSKQFEPEDGKPEGGKVATHTIKQNVLRYWMNRLWHNDPDALMVRRQEKKIRSLDLSLGLLTDEEARTTALNQYWGGGLVCFSEPMAEIEDDRLGTLRHLVPSIAKAALPRDMYQGQRYPTVYDVEIDRSRDGLGIWHTLSVVNWGEEAVHKSIAIDKSVLGSFAEDYETFTVVEFWSGKIWRKVERGSTIDLGELPSHSTFHLKVIPENRNEVVVLSTDGHFSMGGTEIKRMSRSGNDVSVEIDWKWDYPLTVTFLSPEGLTWNECDVDGADTEVDGDYLTVRFEGKFDGVVRASLL